MTDGPSRWQRVAFAIGAGGIGVCAIAALAMPDGVAHFFRAWLVAFNLFTGAAVGSLVIVMVQYLFGAMWGMALRRTLEAAAKTLPLMALLFVPLAFGMDYIFPWARFESVWRNPELKKEPLYADTPTTEDNHELAHKLPYLNKQWWLIRSAFVFLVWIALMGLLTGWTTSRPEDVASKCEAVSAPGMVVYMLTVTIAAIDWGMSLEPNWYSTIYGAMFGMGQALTGFAVCIAVILLLGKRPEVGRVLAGQTMSDLGTLLGAFLMIWAYLGLMQFLIIWMGHLPEELPWYTARMAIESPWRLVAISLIVVHFAIPFVLLMSFAVKRDRGNLLAVTLLVCLMRVVDVFWLLVPAFGRDNGGIDPAGPAAFVLYPAAVVAVGGLWFGVFLWQLRQLPILPESMLKEAGHGEASH